LLLLASPGAALAAALAATAIVLPNAWFTWRLSRMGRERAQQDPSAQARRAVAQSVQRLLSTLLLVAGLVLWLRPEPVAFLGTLLLLQAAFFVAPLFERD
jgi:F0F1-type ATP synthase assembly protein I